MAEASPKGDLLDALRQPGALPARELAALEAWLSTFYPFQRSWILEPERFAACNKSRQTGITHSTAAVVVLWAVFFAEPTSVISVGQREADEIAEKARRHAAILTELGSKWAAHNPKTGEIVFANNGGRVIALPASSGGRSYSGNVFLDEYAYLEHPAQVWDGAAGSALHGFKMRVASTPNGAGNEWHNLWVNPAAHKGWAKHEISIHRAIADGMKIDLDACWKMAKGDPRLFAQMFECSFLDGISQYLPTELIRAAAITPSRMPRVEGVVYAGLDIGLENDLTSLTIIVQDGTGRLWEQETRTCKRTSWEEQESLIVAAHADWDFRRICVDRTGLGRVPAERLSRIIGRGRVEPFDFTLQSKEVLATGLYQALADHVLAILDDPDMVRDLTSLRRIVTNSGHVRYDAPRTAQGHADRAWSLALAVHAASPYVAGRPGLRVDRGEGDFTNE